MPNCETKLGFFILTPCQEEATTQCQDCGKSICGHHSKEIEGKVLCVACAANVPKMQAYVQSYKSDFDDFDRQMWATFNRKMEQSTSYWVPFDIADYESFVIEAQLDLDADYAGGAFFDS